MVRSQLLSDVEIDTEESLRSSILAMPTYKIKFKNAVNCNIVLEVLENNAFELDRFRVLQRDDLDDHNVLKLVKTDILCKNGRKAFILEYFDQTFSRYISQDTSDIEVEKLFEIIK